MPLQSRPVHADCHASRHASSVKLTGNARMLPMRISAIGLTDVTSITYNGNKKNSADVSRNAYTPSRAGEKRGLRRRVGRSVVLVLIVHPSSATRGCEHRTRARGSQAR